MKMTKTVLAVAIGVGFTGEKVDLKSLPASVQETINQKAAGGSIVKVVFHGTA
jgi:hypothetical protein